MFILERKILVKSVGDELPRQRDVEQNLPEVQLVQPYLQDAGHCRRPQ